MNIKSKKSNRTRNIRKKTNIKSNRKSNKKLNRKSNIKTRKSNRKSTRNTNKKNKNLIYRKGGNNYKLENYIEKLNEANSRYYLPIELLINSCVTDTNKYSISDKNKDDVRQKCIDDGLDEMNDEIKKDFIEGLYVYIYYYVLENIYLDAEQLLSIKNSTLKKEEEENSKKIIKTFDKLVSYMNNDTVDTNKKLINLFYFVQELQKEKTDKEDKDFLIEYGLRSSQNDSLIIDWLK